MGRPSAALEEKIAAESAAGWKVVLFNCDCHSVDEVEKVLLLAAKCSLSQARAWSWEVHSKGSAVVYRDSKERCEAVAEIIGSIGLSVAVSR